MSVANQFFARKQCDILLIMNEENKKITLTPTNTTLAIIALINFVGIAFFAGTLHEVAT